MTRDELFRTVDTYNITSFHARDCGYGDFELRFGDDDPLLEIEKLKLEIETLKRQFRFAMAIAFGVPTDRAEELIE